jgi:hypothetical protein
MKRFQSYLVFALVMAAVAGTMVLVPGVALAQNDRAVSSPQPLSAAQAARVEAFWTPERMKQAIPVPTPTMDITEKQAVPSMTITPTGPKIVAHSGKPGDQPVQQRSPAAPLKIIGTAAGTGIQPQYSGGTSSPFTRFRVFPDQKGKTYKQFPHNLVGKIYFIGSDNYLYVASGSVVNSANYSVVWTAGHVVYTNSLVDPGHVGWNQFWAFLPGEYQGKTKNKIWVTTQAWTAANWVNSYWEYDVGALVMLPIRKGPIGWVLGYLGIMFNAPTMQNWTLLGYPQVPQTGGPPGLPFDGEHQELCASTYAFPDQGANGPPTMGVGCDQTPGCSGGPWIVDYNGLPGADNYVNGNFSYSYVGVPLEIYSPYFGDDAAAVYDAAQNASPVTLNK